MTESDYVFIDGDPIDYGRHGQNTLAYQDGEPVVDEGESAIAFENGTGLGIAVSAISITATITTGGDSATLSATDSNGPYPGGGIGFNINGGQLDSPPEKVATWSPITSGGTTVDDYSDGDISEYNGSLSNFSIESGRMKAVTNVDSVFIVSPSGLSHYPQLGETIAYDFVIQDYETTATEFFWATRQETAGDEQSPLGYSIHAASKSTPATPDGFQLRKWTGTNTWVALDESTGIVVSNELGNTISVSINWSSV